MESKDLGLLDLHLMHGTPSLPIIHIACSHVLIWGQDDRIIFTVCQTCPASKDIILKSWKKCKL